MHLVLKMRLSVARKALRFEGSALNLCGQNFNKCKGRSIAQKRVTPRLMRLVFPRPVCGSVGRVGPNLFRCGRIGVFNFGLSIPSRKMPAKAEEVNALLAFFCHSLPLECTKNIPQPSPNLCLLCVLQRSCPIPSTLLPARHARWRGKSLELDGCLSCNQRLLAGAGHRHGGCARRYLP